MWERAALDRAVCPHQVGGIIGSVALLSQDEPTLAQVPDYGMSVQPSGASVRPS
jgi:hypothetical protein